MQVLLRLAGYVALLVTPVAVLAQATPTGDVPPQLLSLGSGVTLVGAVTAATERRTVFEAEGPHLGRADVDAVVAVTVSATAAYVLSVHAGLGPVVASALVGVVAGVGAPGVDTAAYCGSFVGMASPAVFPSVEGVALAGLLTGLAFVVSRGVFAGFGGKLGTLALFGCATAVLLTGVRFGAGPKLPWHTVFLTVPMAVTGAVTTAVLSDRYGLGAVLGSALVGLAAGLLLPVVSPGVGERLATVAFCASFVGMSSSDRLKNEVQVGLAGALCGVAVVAVAPAFAGFGGKLGTTAFISCVALVGAGEVREALASVTP